MNRIDDNVELRIIAPAPVDEILDGPAATKSEIEVAKWGAFKGIFLAAVAGFLISINSLFVKTLHSMSAAELTLIRFAGSMIFSLPFMFFGNVKLELKNFASILAIRSLISSFCMYLRIVGNQSLVLTDSNVINISGPVFVAFFGRICLKEKINRASSIALFFTLVGVTIVSQFWTFSEDADREIVLGTLACFGSIALAAISMIIVRKMVVSGVHPSTVVFHHGWMSGLISIGLTAATDGFELLECEYKALLSNYERMILVVIGTFACQMLINYASKFENATVVSLVKSSIQIFSIFAWQYLFFDKVPSLFSYLGALFVMIGSLVLYFSIWVKTWKDDFPLKKKLLFLTE